MQAFPSHAIHQLILDGDNSPAEEENSPKIISKTIKSRQIPFMDMAKNRIKQKRKESTQEITDELLLWKQFLDHKFQHRD
ncbi:unnamed protein product [Paramecium octaurelia]|uniref:Uncharacterized protein n=1 Tax=Paramecium octaurelia TaxID=43137 RepID=A0A8S1XK96_PAROT|nr:unnamed protein product [Paramecium octaurelia]